MFSKTIFSLLIFVSVLAKAQEAVFIQAPGASPNDFSEVAKNTKGLQTILDLQSSRIQKNPLQEEKIFALGEQLNRPVSELIQEIEDLHRMAPLTLVSLSFLKDLSEKILTRSVTSVEGSFLKNLFCQSGLLVDSSAEVSCKTTKVDLLTIRRQWPQAQALMIESRIIYLDNQNDSSNPSPEILPSVPYHWTLLSNSAQSISFYGTYEQLLQQRLVMENLIEGTCGEFSSRVDDFQVASKALVFFSKDCTKRLYRPIQKTSFAEWIDNNKKWVYPVGGLLIGGALWAAQGKTLIIDKP